VLHPPPDLAIEVDITSRSIPRLPIYAALGVAELWRFDGSQLQVLHLSRQGKYISRSRSKTFPFLPVAEFSRFVLRRKERDQIKILREFRAWVAQLPD
jgi:Uma2 family endonuclease